MVLDRIRLETDLRAPQNWSLCTPRSAHPSRASAQLVLGNQRDDNTTGLE